MIHEVTLSEPILTPKYVETRELNLPINGEKVKVTFRASFEEHPELRDEIRVIRRQFFEEWLPLADALGVAHDGKTPRTFEVKEGEPGEMTAEEAGAWLRKKLIPHIQDYAVGAPSWFTTGMQALLRGDLPKEADRQKCLEGEAETAALLGWVAKQYGRETLVAVSQDCRRGFYDAEIWERFTHKTLEDLVKEYQGAAAAGK